MRARTTAFVVATLGGAVLGYAWNWPGFKAAYEGFIRLFVDPRVPVVTASVAVLLAFTSGVSRICVHRSTPSGMISSGLNFLLAGSIA